MLQTQHYISLQDTLMFSICNMIMAVIRLQLEQGEVLLLVEIISHQVMVETISYIFHQMELLLLEHLRIKKVMVG